MNPIKPLVIFSVLILVITMSCSEKDEFAPCLEGDIIGYAFCFDEYGISLKDHSGIKVVTGPGRKYIAITDKKGRYVLKNVNTGTYDLSFEKENFGTMKLFGIKHLGGEPTVVDYYYSYSKAPFLFQNITTQIADMKYQNDSILADFTFSGEYRPWIVYLRLFFSSVNHFDLLSAEALKNIELHDGVPYYQTFSDYVSTGLPFEAGETVYCKAALYSNNGGAIGVYQLYSVNGISTYYDTKTGTTIYPNLSDETFEFSFTMP